MADANALVALFAEQGNLAGADGGLLLDDATGLALTAGLGVAGSDVNLDRKSTRLNSSHD